MEPPKYRHFVQDILSLDSPVIIRAPVGDIGFYIQLNSGDAKILLCPPDESFEVNVLSLRREGLLRLGSRDIFPIKIWSWECDQAALVFAIVGRTNPKLFKDMFCEMKRKFPTAEFSDTWNRAIDMLSVNTAGVSKLDHERAREASHDAWSTFRRVAELAFEGKPENE